MIDISVLRTNKVGTVYDKEGKMGMEPFSTKNVDGTIGKKRMRTERSS